MEDKHSDHRENALIAFGVLAFLYYKLAPKVISSFYKLKYNLINLANQYWPWALIAFILLLFISFFYFQKRKSKKEEEKEEHTFLGHLKKKNPIMPEKSLLIPDKVRTTHTQVLGTTGCGKTESVILPWIVQDLQKGYGVLIIDGKSDSDFLEKLYGYTKKLNREKDFKLFSFSNIPKSHSFNPLSNGSAVEVAEKVFSSFKFESEYYKNIQYKVFLNLVTLAKEVTTPSFSLIHSLLTDMTLLENYLNRCTNPRAKASLLKLMSLKTTEREERTSGLEAQLSHFVQGECAALFEEGENTISINQALARGEVIYFQLPTMLYPVLSQATGRLVLQSLQSAVAKRHLSTNKDNKLFSVYLDDFQDYIYEGFGSLLNKSRSANIAMVFSHQSLGDLEKVSTAFRDVVLTNTNIKVIMRINDPATCEYFSKSFGTTASFKTTDQIEDGLIGKTTTGKGTLRKVEEFIFHPNVFKQIPIGSGIISIPKANKVEQKEVCFSRLKFITSQKLPLVKKTIQINSSSNKKKKSNILEGTQKRSQKC